MRLHLTSIVPFTVALALLALGFTFNNDYVLVGFYVFMTWGVISHFKNITTVRVEERAPSKATGLTAYKRNYKHETYFHGI